MKLSENDLRNIEINLKYILDRYDLTVEFIEAKVDTFMTLIEENKEVEITYET